MWRVILIFCTNIRPNHHARAQSRNEWFSAMSYIKWMREMMPVEALLCSLYCESILSWCSPGLHLSGQYRSVSITALWQRVCYETAHSFLGISYQPTECKNIFYPMQHNSVNCVIVCTSPPPSSASHLLFYYWIIAAAASFVRAEGRSERVLTFPILPPPPPPPFIAPSHFPSSSATAFLSEVER